MNIEQLKAIITRSMSIDPNDDLCQEKCQKEMADTLSDDISATLKFFESYCTDEELFWISPVFEDIAERTQNRELIKVLRNRIAKVTPEKYNQQNFQSELLRKWVDYTEYIRSINVDISYADDKLK